jgi:hypothetical protein
MFAGTLLVPSRLETELDAPWRTPGDPVEELAPRARDEDDEDEEEDEEEDGYVEDGFDGAYVDADC